MVLGEAPPETIEKVEQGELTVTEATRLLEVAVRLERTARGEPQAVDRHELAGGAVGPIRFREVIVELSPPEDSNEDEDDDPALDD